MHTIGYAAALVAYTSQSVSAQEVAYMTNFLSNFNPVQARYVGFDVRRIIEWLAELFDRTKDVCLILSLTRLTGPN